MAEIQQDSLSGKGVSDSIQQEFDLNRFLKILRKNWFWLVLFPLVSLSTAYLYLRYTKPVYESSSTLKLEINNDKDVLGFQGFGINSNGQNDFLFGEIELLKSNLFYEEVLQSLPLDVSYFEEGRILDTEFYPSAPYAVTSYQIRSKQIYGIKINIKISGEGKYRLNYSINDYEFSEEFLFDKKAVTPHLSLNIHLNNPNYSREKVNYFKINSKEQTLNYLKHNLKAEIVNQRTKLIKVSFQDYNPKKAQRIVKVVDSVYLEKTIENKNKANRQKIEYLNKNIASTDSILRTFEQRIEQFTIQNKVTDIGGKLSDLLREIQELTLLKLKLREELELLTELKVLLMQSDIEKISAFVPEITIPQLIPLLSEYTQILREEQQVLLTEKDNTLAYKSFHSKKDAIKMALNNLIDRSIEKIYEDINKNQTAVNKLEQKFSALPSKMTELNRLDRSRSIYEGYYLQMLNKKTEIGIAEAGVVPDFQVLSSPNTPMHPIAPDKTLIYGIGAALGVFLSFALVVLRYFLHNTISNQQELEKLTPLPVLGSVPVFKSKLALSKLVVHESPKSSISESFRSIRTNLDFMSDLGSKQGGKIISVTSTISGEGKTFVAANLGGIISLANTKVILLDMDLRKPKVHFAFDASNTNGVSNILIGKSELEACIQKSEIEGFDFITSGPIPPNPAELILRPSFNALLEKLRSQYDIVILDSPPVGLVTDGILIMQKADLKLYIVRANYSKKQFINSVNLISKQHKISNMGLIMNAVEYKGSYGYNYGYGYGYGYGGYYEDDTQLDRIKKKLKKDK